MNGKFQWIIPGALLVAALGMAGCEVEKTEEGSLPEVDVKGGNMPEYDVEGPDVNVDSEQRTITVPDVDIDMPDDEPDLGEPVAPRAPVPAPQQN